MIWLLTKAQLKAEIKDRTILARSAPFIGLVLLLFAFAFDPDRGVLSKIAPGLWWVSVIFAAMFVFTKDARNKKETDFINQFGIDSQKILLSRVLTFFILTMIVALISGAGVFVLFSPDINGIFNLIVVAIFASLAISIIGAIYSPLVTKLQDSGQLLSLVVIPLCIPALLAAIQASESAIDSELSNSWSWIGLIVIFCVFFIAVGLLASDSLEE